MDQKNRQVKNRKDWRNDGPRAIAIRSLTRFARDRAYMNLELDASLTRSSMTAQDKALCAALVYGVCERAITLDAQIERMAERESSAFDPETLSALRVGLYQIYYMDKIPAHAAVNETVSAAPARSRGLVNAILRRAIRDGKTPVLPERSDCVEYLSVAHSLPRHIVESWMADYPDDAESLCASANRRPCVTLRVNTLRTTAEELLLRFGERGIEAMPNAICRDMIDVVSPEAVTALPGYDEGLFFVQDASSRICVAALGARPGERIADVCAAPGGKSLSAAIDMDGVGEVFAFDLHEGKLSLLRKSAERLGIGIISTSQNDARRPIESLCGKMDRVLCDAPCSGLGVIAKKPDIRYKPMSEIERLPQLQLEILLASADYVADGGVLVYSTCTLRRAENDGVARGFLAARTDFESEPFEVCGIAAPSGMLTLMPHKHGTDGFFISKFRKK